MERSTSPTRVWGLRGAAQDPARELPFSGFFLIKDGKVTLLGGDQDTPGMLPNGITLSPDEKFLYVTAGGRRTMRYDILPDDTVANGRVFVEHGVDGMRVDTQGNLYTTSGGTPGVIQITSPEGKPLGRLHLPQPAGEPRARVCATNVAFGDDDDRGLYITACTHLFKLHVNQPGVRPGQRDRDSASRTASGIRLTPEALLVPGREPLQFLEPVQHDVDRSRRHSGVAEHSKKAVPTEIRIPGAVHLAHAARSQRAQHFIGTEPCTGSESHGWADYRCGSDTPGPSPVPGRPVSADPS